MLVTVDGGAIDVDEEGSGDGVVGLTAAAEDAAADGLCNCGASSGGAIDGVSLRSLDGHRQKGLWPL